MKRYQVLLAVFLIVMLSILSACDKGEKAATGTAQTKSKAIDACSLLTQTEVDGLFGRSPGPGGPGSPVPVPQVRQCVWPAEGISRLILQVLPAPANVRASIDPGEGYRVIDLDGLSGPAAVAIQQGNPKYGITEGVAIIGIAKGDNMVTLSPVRLEIKEGSPRFELLKKITDNAAQRLWANL